MIEGEMEEDRDEGTRDGEELSACKGQWSPYPSLTAPLWMNRGLFISLENGKMGDLINALLSLPPSCLSFFFSPFRLIKVMHWPVVSRTHWAPMRK